MTWVRLDDEFPKHPKVAEAGPLGMAMQVAGLCYCNHYLTDGYIPRPVAATLLDFEGIGLFTGTYSGEDAHWRIVADRLVEIELWDEVAGGYEIHDYLDYQPSRETVLAERAKKKAAGQAGGQASAQARAKRSASPPAQAESKPVPVPIPTPEPLEAKEEFSIGEGVHKELLVTKLLGRLGEIDAKALADIQKLSEQLPPSALVKACESLEMRPGLKNPVGYVLNTLRSELREMAAA